MKQYIFLLLSLLLASCSEQEIGHETTGGIAGEALRLSVRLGNGAATRAVGDAFASASDEKRIDRLAFFVHTDEDGLQVYPPVPDNVTDPTVASADYPHNVYLAETAAGSRQYTADVTLTAGGGYMADVVAVANLPKDYDYNQIVTWDGLQDSVTVWAAEMPACTPGSGLDDPARRAFVMYGYTRTELVKEETNAFALAMERLAARIDITNEAYVKGMTASDPKGGFLLSSVRLLRAQPASYLTPQPNYASPDVATISDWQVTDIPFGKATALNTDANPTREPDAVDAAVAETNATLQYLWRTLYTYENSDTEHAPTALEIKGSFRGTEVTRRIDFINADKQPVPIVRNHRYLVRILPAPGLTDITFDIKVSEWDAVDTVNVKPDQTEVPVITELETDGTYVEKTKQYDFYHTVDGVISFDAACNFAPDVRVRYEEPGQADWITIEKSEPVLVTKASKLYKSHFKISVSKTTDKVNRKAMLLIHNGGSEVECDTINVRQTYYYPGTELEGIPVEKDGVTTVWAPVNCGATRVATKIYDPTNRLTNEQLKSNQEQQGNLYQWGRKVPFKVQNKGDKIDYVTYNTAAEYAPYEDAMVSGYADDKFIATRYQITNWYCWFRWYNMNDENFSATIIEAGYKWPSENDPCPKGWRVALKNEWVVIVDTMKSDIPDQVNLIWKASSIKGSFVVPACPNITGSTATILYPKTSTYYRTSDYFYSDTYQYAICFNALGASIPESSSSPIVYSTGAPLRCVAK